MNLFKRAATALQQKIGSKVLRASDPEGWASVGSRSWNGNNIQGLKPLEVTAVWACLRLISESIGSMPLHVYKRGADDIRERAVEHPLYDLLHNTPNGQMTPISFKEGIAVSLCCYGIAYLLPTRMESTGRIVSIDPIPVPSVEPIYSREGNGAKGRPIRYRVTLNGRQKEYGIDEIVPIVGWGGNGYEGFAPWHHHKNAIGIAAVADQFAATYFANGAAPGIVLKYDKLLKPEQRTELRKAWKDRHAGAINSGEPIITELGMGVDILKSTMADSQNTEVRKNQMGEIARIWNIPPHMLGDTSKATFNNMEGYNRQFLQNCLGPMMIRIEQGKNLHLLSRAERKTHYVEFDPAGLLMADSKTATENARSEILTGVLTINERRKQLNRPRVEGGDKPFLQINMAPVDTLPTHVNDDEDKEAK